MLTCLMGYGINGMGLIFKTEMVTYQSKANLDEKILFCKITRLQDPKVGKMYVSFWSMICY